MTKAKAAKTRAEKANAIVLTQGPNDDPGEVLAQAILGQNLRHGQVAAAYAGSLINGTGETLGLMDCAKVIEQRATSAISGDLSFASAMLASQSLVLDNMFTEFARRAANNMGEYPAVAERYARLAMKAQANSRTTLEGLAKLHQPREQTVRHVHISEGGQAIVANHFYHQTGGRENEKLCKQSDATGFAVPSTTLPSPNASRNGMPISGSEREAPVQDARRHQPGSA